MQFKQIRTKIHQFADLPLGIIALCALSALSKSGRTLMAWQLLDRITTVCAIDALMEELVEHSLDEPVPNGYKATEHEGHCHWFMDPGPDEVNILGPVMDYYRSRAADQMALDILRQQMADRLKVTDPSSEPSEPSVPFDLNAVGMGLDLSSPEALGDSLGRVLGREVEVIQVTDDGWADLDSTLIHANDEYGDRIVSEPRRAGKATRRAEMLADIDAADDDD